ncbi:MAG: hypothetical protein A2W91_08540 [Bacteroidetes bacterium GWF2_38_335]|nr:MAG: hypothetical protein A2W91_08540 [Bacteroidetes bacterium GWF2_38_335]OFY80427.1 MAG: hypothetical protein A2281_08265 [Bacteroidetes bacterium RIFOXYA12_FULL_38_20]HBS85974.1 hypothetical protein [Bacteroidales bacterium]
MITVVNEPQTEYKVAGWQTEYKGFLIDDFICGIENETVKCCAPSGSTLMIFTEKPKRKLSALRGKLSKQSSKEIDDQISDLRNEWDRNI